MIAGQGFAELITITNLDEFRPIMRAEETRMSRQRATQRARRNPSAHGYFQGEPLTVTSSFIPFRRRHRPTQRTPSARTRASSLTNPSGEQMVLLWTSKPLKRRDLTIPDGATTNQTGSINLDKGLLDASIDHRRYFRDTVFSYCDWHPRKRTVDETYAPFRLKIRDQDIGEFQLAVRHTTSTDTRSYEQRNAMTRLSWGDASRHVRNTSLIGRTMYLYRSSVNPRHFLIEIK